MKSKISAPKFKTQFSAIQVLDLLSSIEVHVDSEREYLLKASSPSSVHIKRRLNRLAKLHAKLLKVIGI